MLLQGDFTLDWQQRVRRSNDGWIFFLLSDIKIEISEFDKTRKLMVNRCQVEMPSMFKVNTDLTDFVHGMLWLVNQNLCNNKCKKNLIWNNKFYSVLFIFLECAKIFACYYVEFNYKFRRVGNIYPFFNIHVQVKSKFYIKKRNYYFLQKKKKLEKSCVQYFCL